MINPRAHDAAEGRGDWRRPTFYPRRDLPPVTNCSEMDGSASSVMVILSAPAVGFFRFASKGNFGWPASLGPAEPPYVFSLAVEDLH